MENEKYCCEKIESLHSLIHMINAFATRYLVTVNSFGLATSHAVAMFIYLLAPNVCFQREMVLYVTCFLLKSVACDSFLI